jgi:hypothetical protein
VPEAQPYATTRTCKWIANNPGEDFLHILRNIQKFGCHIMQVKGTSTTPGWSYSIGLFDTTHQPEIITVGMPQAAAVTAVNKAAKLLRQGIDLTAGRISDLISNRNAEFRPVDPKWVDHLMGRALFYYDDEIPPALQMVYPDLNNRFQHDPGFDERFRQPLLQSDAPQTPKEEDFWKHG